VLLLATLARCWAPEAVGTASVEVRPAVTLRPHGGLPMVLRRRGQEGSASTSTVASSE